MTLYQEENRSEFMFHAYSALWTGNIEKWDDDLQREVMFEIMRDVHRWAHRHLTVDEREKFFAEAQKRAEVH